MRLYLNDTSPFARLVLVTALEVGVKDMDLIWIDPWASPERLLALNPFSTIPTLRLNDDTALYESLIICEHLIATAEPTRSALTHTEYGNPAALQQLALGKSLMELSFRKVIMERFASDASGNILLERAHAALVRALSGLDALLEKQPSIQHASVNLPNMCLAVAVEYVRFRLNDVFDAHVGQHALTWLSAWHARSSFECTAPERLKVQPASILELRSDSV
ncbi:glutathione S-transferase family protein [Hydromonas duriensis]|uniref:Glutathione S-transferase n=1 Tax=Hydromonas duriensis TaxID=1527608 RepID=A0A4R6Y0S6_9BURK|nr:glutathione S-transferase family protein [Hydromonas duriensis]TDR27841.1 glutathione S-transferase [Hydromonas duriensis]